VLLVVMQATHSSTKSIPTKMAQSTELNFPTSLVEQLVASVLVVVSDHHHTNHQAFHHQPEVLSALMPDLLVLLVVHHSTHQVLPLVLVLVLLVDHTMYQQLTMV
jgi:hypothetical protein